MKKFGWEFQAAWSSFERDQDYNTALPAFLAHFNEHDDEESLAKIIACYRLLRDFAAGFALLERVYDAFSTSRIIRSEAFLFTYEREVGEEKRRRRWEAALSLLDLLRETDSGVPQELVARVQIDELEMSWHAGDWKRYLEVYHTTDFSGLTAARRNVFKDGLRNAYHRRINELIDDEAFQKAFELCRSAAHVFPKELSFIRKQALCLEKSDMLQFAREVLEGALKKGASWLLHFDLAKILLSLGQREEALQHGLNAYCCPGSMQSKYRLLLWLYGMIRPIEGEEETVRMLAFCLIRMRENSLLSVPEELMPYYNDFMNFVRFDGQVSDKILKIMTDNLLTSMRVEKESTAASYRHRGRLSESRRQDDYLEIIVDGHLEQRVLCRKEDLPPDIARGNGRLLFSISEAGYFGDNREFQRAENIVPDVLANRRHDDQRLAIFSYWR